MAERETGPYTRALSKAPDFAGSCPPNLAISCGRVFERAPPPTPESRKRAGSGTCPPENAPVEGRVPECEERIGSGPPQARTEVIYVDLGYWATSGSLTLKARRFAGVQMRVGRDHHIRAVPDLRHFQEPLPGASPAADAVD